MFSEMDINKIKVVVSELSGWLKFLGIVNIVAGAIGALTLVGIVVAWIPIWLGVLLYQAGSKSSEFTLNSNLDSLAQMLAKLKVYFIVQGIFIIIGIIGTIVFLITALSSPWTHSPFWNY